MPYISPSGLWCLLVRGQTSEGTFKMYVFIVWYSWCLYYWLYLFRCPICASPLYDWWPTSRRCWLLEVEALVALRPLLTLSLTADWAGLRKTATTRCWQLTEDLLFQTQQTDLMGELGQHCRLTDVYRNLWTLSLLHKVEVCMNKYNFHHISCS